MRCLDLFSGIGGFAYALKSVVTQTVAYCDCDPACRQVLRDNIQRGLLDGAPIFEDVATLPLEHIATVLKPTLITAGFPCQDISVANVNGAGIHGKRSGLFKHILRIVDAVPSIDAVFLENSSRILHAGYDYVERQFEARGFATIYCLLRASDVGAYHKRLRWFCLCYRRDTVDLLSRLVPQQEMRFDWDAWEKYMAVTVVRAHLKKAIVARCGMLGNSVVPQCVMHAWNTLITAARSSAVPSHRVQCRPYKKAPALHLVFSDGQRKIEKRAWATPVHSVWHNYASLTDRGERLLSNQAYYYTAHVSEQDKRTCYGEYVVCDTFRVRTAERGLDYST